MTILEMLNNKISDLKKNSQEELSRITNVLNVIDDSIDALNDEIKLKDYDFSIAINLVNSNSFGIIDLEKTIKDVKNILIAKYNYNQVYLTINEDGKRAIKSFRERLGYLKEELERRIDEQSKIEVDEHTLENLIDFRNLLDGKGRRKYYTYEMIESFFEVFDYDNFTYEDMEELIKELAVSRNIKGKIEEDKKDFNEVKSLFNEYLDKRFKLSLLEKYQDEICSRIDLVNARNILEFFRINKLLDRFSIVAILQIVLYGNYNYIKDFYYERVLPKDNNIKELYFEDIMSCVWINERSTERRRNTSIKKSNDKSKSKSLYSHINEVCDDDVWENIRILKENEDILSDKYDLSNIDYLWVITKPTWLIKKNIELFRLFNIRDVRLTALVQNDLEEKIHFVIELGLLNTPRNQIFRDLEQNVPKYNEYMINGKKKETYNGNILNYYGRNTTEIGKTSYTEYIYWFYRMQRSGKDAFYQDFFSSSKAGRRNKTDFYDDKDLDTINNREEFDQMVATNFVVNYYDTLIDNYDVYDEVIRDYISSQRGDIIVPYFDSSIINDNALENLERYMVVDVYGIEEKVNNPYVYLFDRTIISRYKVLRNLSILKGKYGYLNDDMILTSVVRGSFINKATFDEIKERIKSEVLVI